MKKNSIKILAGIASALLLCSCSGKTLPPLSGGSTTAPTTTAPVTDSPVTDAPDNSEAYNSAEIYSGMLKENGRYDLKATDYVTVTDSLIKGVKLPKSVHTASEDDVTVALAGILSEFADPTVHLDREIRLGDTVNIDYVGSIDGVEFEGGNTMGNGTNVTVGVTSYIDDFLFQLIGHKAGELVNIEVTFPEDYGKEELNGKDAVFVTKINYVLNTPELTDEFVSTELAAYGCKTADELLSQIKTGIVTEATDNYVFNYLGTAFTVKETPAVMVEHQLEQMLDYYYGYAQSYGMDIDTFLSYMGTTKDALMTEMRPQCELIAKRNLVCQAVAETIGYEASDTDLLAYFGEYYGTTDLTDYKEYYGTPYLKQIVTEREIIDYIIENAVKE